MFDFLKNNPNFTTYSVDKNDIDISEQRIGYSFPLQLKMFYHEVGYGFINGSKNFINRLMSPDDIADFICNEEYEYVDKTIYPTDELVFYHISGEDFLTIGLVGEEKGKIKYFGDVIATDLIDFVKKSMDNPNYFI